MRTKNFILPIVGLVASILLIAFEWIKFDLAIRLNAFAVGVLTWIVYILYALLGVGSIIYAILMSRTIKWQAFIPVAIVLITVLYAFLWPLSGFHLNSEFEKNMARRTETVGLVESNQISEYQINVDEYMVPYRETSCTGTMLVQQRNGVTKVMFYSYKGLSGTKVIVYVSDDSGIKANDFNFNLPAYTQKYSNVKKMAPNWYSADITS